jgi:hypothetical protein
MDALSNGASTEVCVTYKFLRENGAIRIENVLGGTTYKRSLIWMGSVWLQVAPDFFDDHQWFESGEYFYTLQELLAAVETSKFSGSEASLVQVVI